LPYSLADVWDAVTNPSRLAEWWLPFEADVTIDLREGGEMKMAAVGGDPPPMTFTIIRVEPPLLLEHTHIDPGSMLRWELAAAESGCVLRLSHFVADPTEAIESCYVVGLHTSLSRLQPCLAGTPTTWDWDEFAQSQEQYAEAGLAPHPRGGDDD
jgi:uncharacterized protein YndB with AHSA1/START domain